MNALKAYDNQLEEDQSKLINAFNDRKGDLSSWDGCIDALKEHHNDALGILQSLALVTDNEGSRACFFAYAEHLIRHCLFGTGEDAQFPHSLKYGLQADEAIARSEEDSYLKNLLHKLRETNRIKEEATTKCTQYQMKLSEYQNEVKELRAHIADPTKTSIPPETSCVLPAVNVQSSFSAAPVKSVSSAPPPPPGPPPILSGKGPPAPPPPPPNLLKGGPPAPPPPPPNLLKGGPPAPPPPPPNLLKGGPPAPPPPSANLLKGGPNAPPTLNLASNVVFMPPLPTYLKEKKQVKSEFQLKKLHWKDMIVSFLNDIF